MLLLVKVCIAAGLLAGTAEVPVQEPIATDALFPEATQVEAPVRVLRDVDGAAGGACRGQAGGGRLLRGLFSTEWHEVV